MTAYFDTFMDRLDTLRRACLKGGLTAQEDARKLLERLHYDVCLCLSEAGFPSDIRDAIHLVFARHDPEPLPCIERDFSGHDEWFAALGQIGSDLHTLFHSLSERRLAGFSDSPLTPCQRRASAEEEYRIALCRRTPGFEDLVGRYDRMIADAEASRL